MLISTIKKKLKKIKQKQEKKTIKKLQYEFLPSALEIAETPPSPLGKNVILGIFSIMIVAIVWSSIGKIDEVAVARGKVVPDGRLKVVQSLQEGIITAIYVSEGEHVRAGQNLIELDATIKKVDQETIAQNLNIAKLEKELLQKSLNDEDIESFVKLANIPENIKTDLLELYYSRKKNYEGKKESLNMMVRQAEEALNIAISDLQKMNQSVEQTKIKENTLRKLKNTSGYETVNLDKILQNIQILEEEEKKYEILYQEGAIAEMTWLEKRNAVDLLKREYENQKARSYQEQISNELNWNATKNQVTLGQKEANTQSLRVAQAQSKLQESRTALQNLDSETKTEALSLIVEKEKQIQQLMSELQKAQKSLELQSLSSPTAGVVQGLAASTIGGVVTPAQPIMTIVPEDTPLIIEANIQNKDIGFVSEGQEASIKIDTFSYQRYGLLKGTVEKVSPDAFEDEKQGLVYKIKVSIPKQKLQVEGKEVSLSPGMAVTVEVKTGQRRVIEFFLEPLVKYAKESLTVR